MASEPVQYLLTQQDIIADLGKFFRLLILYGQDSTQRRWHRHGVVSLIVEAGKLRTFF